MIDRTAVGRSLTRRLRVLHVFRGFSDYVRELLSAEAIGSEVHILAPQTEIEAVAEHEPAIHTHRTTIMRVRNPINFWRALRLRSLICHINPDIIHVQSCLLWEHAFLLKPRRYPIILTLHDVHKHPTWNTLGGQESITRIADDFAVRRADAVIVHGDTNRKVLLERFGKSLDTNRVYNMDHGVIQRYGRGSARLTVPPGQGNLLFFGRIDKYKGIEDLVEAARTLQSTLPGISTVVAGAPVNLRASQYCSQLGREMPGVSVRCGHQSKEDVERLFRWADVVVLPYVEASQSGVLQIAVAFGVPPVVSRVGGLPDVVSHGVNGLVVEPGDPRGLAKAIREILTNQELRRKIVANLQNDRELRFSWSRIGGQTVEVYREVIARFRQGKRW